MTVSFQFTQRLQASAALCLATGVIKDKLFADMGGQFASVKDLCTPQQIANILDAGGLRQSPFDLVLCVHAARMHGKRLIFQSLLMGKGQHYLMSAAC